MTVQFRQVALIAGMLAALAPAAARAREPDSFIARVQQSQGIGPVTDAPVHAVAAREPTQQGEPASFVVRVKQSQGILPSAGDSTMVALAAGAAADGEPASFIGRVKRGQRLTTGMP